MEFQLRVTLIAALCGILVMATIILALVFKVKRYEDILRGKAKAEVDKFIGKKDRDKLDDLSTSLEALSIQGTAYGLVVTLLIEEMKRTNSLQEAWAYVRANSGMNEDILKDFQEDWRTFCLQVYGVESFIDSNLDLDLENIPWSADELRVRHEQRVKENHDD